MRSGGSCPDEEQLLNIIVDLYALAYRLHIGVLQRRLKPDCVFSQTYVRGSIQLHQGGNIVPN